MPELITSVTAPGATGDLEMTGPAGVMVMFLDGPAAWQILQVSEPPSELVTAVFTYHVCTPACTQAAERCSMPQIVRREIVYHIVCYEYCIGIPGPSQPRGHVRLAWSEAPPTPWEIRQRTEFILAWTGLLPWELVRSEPPAPGDTEPIVEHPGSPRHTFGYCNPTFEPYVEEPRTYIGQCACGWRTWPPVSPGRLPELAQLCQRHGADRRRPVRVEGLPSASGHRAVTAPAAPVAPTGALDTPEAGTTCAHVCGPDPDHTCDARASTHLDYTNLAGGIRRLPLCAPCHHSERAALNAAAAATPDQPAQGADHTRENDA